MEPEARLNGDEARATREKIRSIGHGSAIDDYIFEWADKSHLRNQKRKQSLDCFFRFWNDVFRKRNVMRTSCVMTASPCDVRFAREDAEHITSLRPTGATSLCVALHHLPVRANITLYKQA